MQHMMMFDIILNAIRHDTRLTWALQHVPYVVAALHWLDPCQDGRHGFLDDSKLNLCAT